MPLLPPSPNAQFSVVNYDRGKLPQICDDVTPRHVPAALALFENEGRLLTVDATTASGHDIRSIVTEANLMGPFGLDTPEEAVNNRYDLGLTGLVVGRWAIKAKQGHNPNFKPRLYVPVLFRDAESAEGQVAEAFPNGKVAWRRPREAMQVLAHDQKDQGIRGSQRREIVQYVMQKADAIL